MSVNVNVHFGAEFMSYPRHIVVSMRYTWMHEDDAQGWCSALVTRLGRNVAVVRTWPGEAIGHLVRAMREHGWPMADPLPGCAWSVMWEPENIGSARLGELADACVGMGVNAYGYDLCDDVESAEPHRGEHDGDRGEAKSGESRRLTVLANAGAGLSEHAGAGYVGESNLVRNRHDVLPIRVGRLTPRAGKRIVFAELTVVMTSSEAGVPGAVQAYTHLYGAGGDLVRARAACRRRFVVDTLRAEHGIVALRIDHLEVCAGMSDVAVVARDLSDCLLAAGCAGPVIIRRVTGMDLLDGAMST